MAVLWQSPEWLDLHTLHLSLWVVKIVPSFRPSRCPSLRWTKALPSWFNNLSATHSLFIGAHKDKESPDKCSAAFYRAEGGGPYLIHSFAIVASTPFLSAGSSPFYFQQPKSNRLFMSQRSDIKMTGHGPGEGRGERTPFRINMIIITNRSCWSCAESWTRPSLVPSAEDKAYWPSGMTPMLLSF